MLTPIWSALIPKLQEHMQSAWIWSVTQSSCFRRRRAKTARQDRETADWCSWGLHQAKKQSWLSFSGFWVLFFWNSATKVLVQENLLHFPIVLSLIYVHDRLKWHTGPYTSVMMYLEFRIIPLLTPDDCGGTENLLFAFFFFFNKITFHSYFYSLIGPPRSITKTRLGEDENGFLDFTLFRFILNAARLQVPGGLHCQQWTEMIWGSLWHW